MSSILKQSRVAGFIYLLLVVASPLRLMYIPSTLFVDGKAAVTAANIAAHERLFRFGMACDLFSAVILIFLVLALHRLFKDVDRHLAALMVVLGGVIPSAIYCFNLLNDAGALAFARSGDFSAAFAQPQREALVALFLHLHHQVVVVAEAFWGLWLFPLAALTYRSNFLPRFLSIWLVINGVAYLALCLTGLLWPQWEGRVSSLAFPALLGEIVFMLWILIRGARVQGIS
jgi:Domain of unknown function (DUF4386)